MKHVLIAGISGYIGSHLALDLLKKGIKVFGLVRKPLHSEYIIDFKNKLNLYTYDGSYESVLKAVESSKPDIVYHMATCYAANHSSNQIADINSCNILFGNYILEAMKEYNIKNIVYPSTAFCHYNNGKYNPLNLYSATKQAFSDIMRYYTDACGISSLTLVLTDSYGPGDRRQKILNLIKRAYRENKPIELSSGTQVYDVLYIDDIVNALEQAGILLEQQKESSSVYQIYNKNPLTLKETVELMKKTVNVQIGTRWGARPQPKRSIDNKVRVDPLLPGWNIQVPLEEGLKKFWFDDNI